MKRTVPTVRLWGCLPPKQKSRATDTTIALATNLILGPMLVTSFFECVGWRGELAWALAWEPGIADSGQNLGAGSACKI